MPRARKDQFYKKAKKEGYRSRAAYKLKQINKKFNIIKKYDTVVDLGAAPGGWLQVAKEISGGKIIGVDLQSIKPIEGVITIKGDITSSYTLRYIKNLIDMADVVLCDASPNLSGNWSYDHARSIDIAESALNCAKEILKPNGNFVVKVFQGDMFDSYLNNARDNFKFTKAYTPFASRKQSAEIYIIGKKKK